MQAGKLAGQFFAAYVPPKHPKPAGFALAQIALMRDILKRHADVFRPGLCADDVAAAKAEGRIALFMTIENGSALDNELDALDAYYDLGVRLMTLCHNDTHDWCDSATDAPRHDGLTAFGKDVIRRMNRLGMVVDLAHVSPKVMHDTLDVTSAPLFWSHSNAFSLCDHPRNVPDDVLDRVAGNGGVVMATFVPDFISQASRDWHRPAKDQYGKTPEGLDYAKAEEEITAQGRARARRRRCRSTATISTIWRSASAMTISASAPTSSAGSIPTGWRTAPPSPALIAELIRRGWSEENLEKLAGGNTLRAMRAVEQAAG